MLVAVIDQRRGQEQHARAFEQFCAEPLGAFALQPHETDRARARTMPLETIRMAREEGV